MNPNYVVPAGTQFRSGTKGVKKPIFMLDPITGVHVMFVSKADLSAYLWGAKNRAQALDRYLARVNGKAPLAFKGHLLFFYGTDLPENVIAISMSDYYSLIGGNRYIHPRETL